MQIDSGSLVIPNINFRTLSVTMTGSPVQLTNSPLTISNCAASATTGIVTVATSSAHQLIVGQFVNIVGTTDGRYQGQYPVTVVVDSTHFKYQLPFSVTGNLNFSNIVADTLAGTPQVTYRIEAQKMGFVVPAHAVTIGPDSTASTIPVTAAGTVSTNGVFWITSARESKFYLDNWYATGTAADVLKIIYA